MGGGMRNLSKERLLIDCITQHNITRLLGPVVIRTFGAHDTVVLGSKDSNATPELKSTDSGDYTNVSEQHGVARHSGVIEGPFLALE